MNSYPPSLAELFEHAPDSAVSSYSRKVWNELMSDARGFRDRNRDEQQAISSLVRDLDSYASLAASRLQNSQFTESERRFFAPPDRAVKGEMYKTWKLEQQDQLCIDDARSAREAIFQGVFLSALVAQGRLVSHAQGRFTERSFSMLASLTKKGSKKPPNTALEKRNQMINEDAEKIRKANPHLADSRIAAILEEKYKSPKAEMLRKIMAAHRK